VAWPWRIFARSLAVPAVRLSRHARASYERLARNDPALFRRVDRALDRLAEEPVVGKPLAGPLRGHRSYRVGPIRIVYRYEADAEVVLILDLAQRDRVYRRRG
jgi:mRNA-degrading endonuclease RelE of RelBE toxin-antitoxin system